MCRAKCDGGRRCEGRTKWLVNREAHERYAPDDAQERHWLKPPSLLSMQPGAIRIRRHRANKYAAEVCAMRTVHGVLSHEPIGPVLREELWSHRYQGAGLSLIALADRFRAIAADEGVSVEEVGERYQTQQVKPHRQSTGERLAALVVDDEAPDWANPSRLVQMVEPPENGTPSQVYVRVVRDLDGVEFVLVTSYDGSEPMAWKHDPAGLKGAAKEALGRVLAINGHPTAYEAWLVDNDMGPGTDASPWTQAMSDADFLANTDGMHLV